jgi:predicted RNA-binding Zn-ribbon protein involved in translation (DUF1610 family)
MPTLCQHETVTIFGSESRGLSNFIMLSCDSCFYEFETETNATELPCLECGVMISADVHTQGLGFCLPCSDKFWSHEDE